MNCWSNELPCAVTVMDTEGIILEMNEKAKATFAKWGGGALIGKSLYDCHNPSSGETIRTLLRENRSNSYTIEKGGKKKLIHQTPWYRDGVIAGLVEISIELPDAMPHFVRPS
jgi:transcriptional regulator with PAS, ATPase and Fis domain